jgi:serine O-acetyltransferase
MYKTIREDIQKMFTGDPVAKSVLNVVFCYSGLHALWFHRISHFLLKHKLRFSTRFISHIIRFLTNMKYTRGQKSAIEDYLRKNERNL